MVIDRHTHVHTIAITLGQIKAGSQYDARACITSRRLHVDAHRNARIDSDSILAFLCVAFLRLVVKKLRKFEYFRVSQAQRNAMQCKSLASYCELGLRLCISPASIYIVPGTILR